MIQDKLKSDLKIYDRKAHYKIETEIATRLRNSTSAERTELYRWAYDSLYQRIPNHPMLSPVTEQEHQARIAKDRRNMEVFLRDDTVFLEVGAGNCEFAAEVAKKAKTVIALEVSGVIANQFDEIPNFRLILFDGINFPVPENSVDLAYSNQLMEHLHAEDAINQLSSIYRVLKPGGVYFCITPNRLSGPHDISRDFDGVATGLHLREYSVTEMAKILRECGFSKTKIYLRFFKFGAFIPIFPYKICEAAIDVLPHRVRKLLTFNKVFRFLLGVKIAGVKPIDG